MCVTNKIISNIKRYAYLQSFYLDYIIAQYQKQRSGVIWHFLW